MKVLLVEDENISRIALAEALRKAGFEVVACENGNEGLEWIEEDRFEAVITDLRLPDVDGIEILKAEAQGKGMCSNRRHRLWHGGNRSGGPKTGCVRLPDQTICHRQAPYHAQEHPSIP